MFTPPRENDNARPSRPSGLSTLIVVAGAVGILAFDTCGEKNGVLPDSAPPSAPSDSTKRDGDPTEDDATGGVYGLSLPSRPVKIEGIS
jgi:hypothetical protein